MPKWVRRWFIRVDIRRIKRFSKLSKWDLVWSFDPFRFQYLELFGADKTIYHCVDLHKTGLEREVTESADLILTTSLRLKRKLEQFRSPASIHNLGHGLAHHFVVHEPNEPSGKKVKVGLIGNLLYPFLDYHHLRKIIEGSPKVEFHFIGPYEEGSGYWYSKLLSAKNVIFHGSKKSDTLPSFMDEFQLFLICYDTKRFRSHLDNPHKILEYLSSGKVTVSHQIDEYLVYDGLIEMVGDNQDLPKRFADVVRNISYCNSPEKMKRRRTFALERTYEIKVDQILDLLEEASS